MSSFGFSEREKKVLARVEFLPGSSAESVAQSAKLKGTTVSYVLRRLKDSGSIRQYAIINPYRLGYNVVALYFSMMDQGEAQRAELLKRIVAHPQVVYARTLLGDYQYQLVLICSSLREIRSLTAEIFGGAGDVFSNKLLAPRIGIHLFSKKYLDRSYNTQDEFTLVSDDEVVTLDELDSEILQYVANNGFESAREVARVLKEPFSTVERRLKGLAQKGVIAGTLYRINRESLGVQSYRLLLSQKGFCSSTRESILDYCRAHKNIVYLIESVGAWDFEIGVEAAESIVATQITEELYGLCGMRVAWIKVLVDVERLKCSLFPIGLKLD